jgi:hypothetical protein
MRINEMPHARIAADENKLLKRGTGATRFENPKQTFDRHIHDLIGSLFAGRQMIDMRHTYHRFFQQHQDIRWKHECFQFAQEVRVHDCGIRPGL